MKPFSNIFLEYKIEGMKKILKLILLIGWMGLIFYMSSCNGEASSAMSSGLLKTIAQFIGISDIDSFIRNYSFLIRKTAHFSEYAVLGFLVYINLKEYIKYRYLLISFVLSAGYAASDELHQMFVSERSFALMDIFIDSCGALTGIVLIHLITVYAAKRKNFKVRN